MCKQKLLKSVALTVAVICLFLFSACGGDSSKETAEPNPSQTGAEGENHTFAPGSSSTETNPESSEASSEASSETSSETPSKQIVKINGAADEVGIYSVVVKLTDHAADKGEIEMVYYGAKGSPQENSIVNRFRIEYEKEPAGTFEIQTFFDGEVYQNLHHKNEVKVTNTFGATLRAGSVIISYTPDGGDKQEVFRADAEYFFVPTN